jgi:hypothetical protein
MSRWAARLPVFTHTSCGPQPVLSTHAVSAEAAACFALDGGDVSWSWALNPYVFSSSGTCIRRWAPSSCRTRPRSWRARSTCATGACRLQLPTSAAHGQAHFVSVRDMAACNIMCTGRLQAAA